MLSDYIFCISNDISNYIIKTIYQFYLTNVNIYITQWNNGFYQNLHLLNSQWNINHKYWDNTWDIMQDDIDGKLYQETDNNPDYSN